MQEQINAINIKLAMIAGRLDRLETQKDTKPAGAIVTRAQSDAIVTAATDRAYEQIMSELSTTVFPEMNKLAQMVHYQAQDSDGLVDEYRRRVESRNDTGKRITDGKKDTRVIGPYVRTFFGEDD